MHSFSEYNVEAYKYERLTGDCERKDAGGRGTVGLIWIRGGDRRTDFYCRKVLKDWLKNFTQR